MIVLAAGLLGVAVGAGSGCGPSRPKRIEPPPINPAVVTAAIMKAADVDGDGSLDRQELAKVPGLVAAVTILDSDKSGGLSAGEISGWLDEVKGSRVAITSFAASVIQNGKPVAGATVKLVPEAFMGGELKAAEGTTDATGGVMVSIPGSPYPGVNCGIYRVEISGNGADGRPLPAKYNTETTLGVAIGGMFPENGMVTFELE